MVEEQWGSADYAVIDLTDSDATRDLMDSLLKEYSVEVLINNAGFGDYGNFEEIEIWHELKMIDLNCRTLTYLTHLVGKDMIQQSRPWYILNVASTAAFQPWPTMAVYFATKSYVLSFSEAVRFEWKWNDVHVTTLCPGATKTEFFDRSKVADSSAMVQNMMRSDIVVSQGLEGLFAKKSVIIPWFTNKVMYYLTAITPRSLVMGIVKNIMKK